MPAFSTEVAHQLGQDAADQEFINRAFVRILGRSPVQEERTACVEFLQGQSGNSHARRTLIHALLNHNDFVTVR